MSVLERSQRFSFEIVGVIVGVIAAGMVEVIATVVSVEVAVGPREIEAVARGCGAGHSGKRRIGVECRAQDRRLQVREDR